MYLLPVKYVPAPRALLPASTMSHRPSLSLLFINSYGAGFSLHVPALALILLPRFWARPDALAFVSAVVLPNSGNAAAILLDGCDFGPPPSARFRTNLLLPVSRPGLFFRQQPLGIERPALLRKATACPDALCLDLALPGALACSPFPAAP